MLSAADLLYSTGEPLGVTVIADGSVTNGGYISGFLDPVSFGRYTATSFTLAEDVSIEEAVVYWFDDSDNVTLSPTTTLEWTIYADDAGGGPGTVVASGELPYVDVVSEEWIDPIFALVTDWKRRLPLVTDLAAGTYWISFHGVEGSVAWLTGAADGGDVLYRATNGTNYSLYINTIWQTTDPVDVYHTAFELYGTAGGEPVCEGDANGDNVVDPLDSGYVLSRFGCPVGTGDPSCDAADQNLDGVVDPLDAGFVLSRFGDCPSGISAPGPDLGAKVRHQALLPVTPNDDPEPVVPSLD
jgi:hypothetical protein